MHGINPRSEWPNGTSIDTTATRAIEQQLHEGQRVRSIGVLAGGLAHDFNNALAVLLGNIDIVAHHDAVVEDPDLAASLDAMKRATTRASALTRKLMSLGRHGDSHTEVLSAGEVLRNAATLISPALGSVVEINVETGIEPVVDGPVMGDELAVSPVAVAADPTQLEQVLLDLVLNARDAEATTVDLRVDRVRVEVGDELERAWGLTPGAYGVLSVTDDGAGMDAETQRGVFDPFFTTKNADDGSGLGLTNADRFARRAGGALVPTSHAGRGTTMALYLPLVEADDEIDLAAP